MSFDGGVKRRIADASLGTCCAPFRPEQHPEGHVNIAVALVRIHQSHTPWSIQRFAVSSLASSPRPS